MINLMYYSTATNMYSVEDLIFLEKQCIEGNTPLGVTGILLYNRGCIKEFKRVRKN